MKILRTIPAALALIVLGAHFLRSHDLPLVVVCLLFVPFAFVRKPAAVWAVRAVLVFSALVWSSTAWSIYEMRVAAGQPSTRMLVILSGVALFGLFAAALLPGVSRARNEGEPAVGEQATPDRDV